MSHFKSVQTGVFRGVVAVSWKFVPSEHPYHCSWERRHTCRHLPDFIRNCETQTIMSDRQMCSAVFAWPIQQWDALATSL